MRKWLLIGMTLLLLVAVFAAVMWSQRGVRVIVTTDRPLPASRPTASTKMGSIGRVESAWVMTYDSSTGLPQARFRGEQFVPQQGDQVLVEGPQVEFFIGRDRKEVVRIVGKTGLVIIPGEGPRIRSDFTATPSQAPSRGEMRDVTVTYYRTQEAATAGRPELTLTLNNAYFDSELYEIATEDYTDEKGVKVAGKEVPVIVRGESFEFDGQGLQIRWDEHSQRLKSLTIFKGHQLVIKRPAEELRRQGRAMGRSLPLQLVAADNKQAVAAAAQRDSITDHIFRATFHGGVKLTQKEETLATAQQMHVDFLDRSSGPVTGAAKPAAPGNGRAPAAKPQAAKPQSGKASEPMGMNPEEPLVIRWGGQMTVTPAPDEPLKPQNEDDAVVRFAGTADEPVHLFGEGGEITALWAAYQSDSQYAWVEGAAGRPVRMTDSGGSVLLTPQLRYSQKEGKAILRGPSSALVKTKQNGKDEELKATWQDLAEATFVSSGESRAISSLALKGGVKVEHPQLKQFDAGVLRLDFDRGSQAAKSAQGGSTRAAGAQLKQITASDQVYCVIVGDDSVPQSIKAQSLAIQMAMDAKGERHPSGLTASGSVVAGTDVEQIAADTIQAELEAPADRAKADSAERRAEIAGLQKLVAAGHVKVRSAKGETIAADRLQVRQSQSRSSWVLLEGAPAVVSQDQTSIAGPYIELDTASDRATTTGGGRMVMPVGGNNPGEKAMPVEVTWTGDGSVDGAKNMASVAGNVVIKYTDPDGSIDEAQGDRVEIELALKDTAKATPEKNGRSFLADRYPRKLTLLPSEGKDVRLQSLLPGPAGTIARQTNLLGPRLDLFLDQKGIERMEVPAAQDRPGRLLYIDMPAATRQPMKTGDPLKTRELPGSTAVAWRQLLRYEKAANQLTLTGGVMIRHEPQTPGGKGFMVDADTIVADLVEKGGAARTGESVDVRKLTLSGAPVHLVRDDVELTSPMIEIDPATKTVVARSGASSPVDVQKGRMVGTFEWVQINSQTSDMQFGRAMGSGRQ